MNDYYTKQDLIENLDLDQERYDTIPPDDIVKETIKNIKKQNIKVKLLENKEEALQYLKTEIEKGITLNMGHSTTLKEIGFVDYLKSNEHSWDNWANKVRKVGNKKKREEVRRKGVVVNTFLDSPNAISTSGELIAVNAKGNGISAWPYPAKNLILVSGVNKIVKSWDEAINRVKKFALPLENERAKKVYDTSSRIGTLISYEYETEKNRSQLILINENLGL